MHAARSPAAAPLGGCARRRAPRSRPQAPTALANTFGQLFRVTTFGESHGGGVGCVVDGVPPRLRLAASDLQAELDRRRPGQSRITTPRSEEDTCEILSGAWRYRAWRCGAACALPSHTPKACPRTA